MKSDAKRQAEYQARQVSKGKARLNCWIDTSTKQAIGELSEQHGKTAAEVIKLGITAAFSMLAGRLTVSRAAAQPPTSVIIRKPQERAQALDPAAGNTNTPAPPEDAPTAPLHEPERPADDIDARIRAAGAAWIVEP